MIKPSPKNVHSEITKILSYLIEIGIVSDQNFPTLQHLSNQTTEVGFPTPNGLSFLQKRSSYDDLYKEIQGERCFSAQFIDGGIIQLSYRFKSNELLQHRLAFYPSPSLDRFSESPEDYMNDEVFHEIISRRIIAFPLRFDFDGEQAIDTNHPHSHLTLGDVTHCRIPLTAALTPRWFVEFILSNFYQSPRIEFITNLPAHKHHFVPTITANEERLIHLAVPKR